MTNKTLRVIGEHPDLIRPFGNYIVIEIMKTEKESLGGVVLPDQVVANDRQMLARVISVGPGQRSLLTGEFMPLQCSPGDMVVILRHAPVEVKLAGKVAHIIFEGDILGKVDEETLNTLLVEQEAEEPVAEEETYQVAEDVSAKVEKTESGIFVVRS